MEGKYFLDRPGSAGGRILRRWSPPPGVAGTATETGWLVEFFDEKELARGVEVPKWEILITERTIKRWDLFPDRESFSRSRQSTTKN